MPTDLAAWTPIDGLAGPIVKTKAEARPQVTVVARPAGLTVVRMDFRAGDVMADHRAVWPILVMTQVGTVRVTIGEDAVELVAGGAVHIARNVMHELVAVTDAVVTLLVLHPDAA